MIDLIKSILITDRERKDKLFKGSFLVNIL